MEFMLSREVPPRLLNASLGPGRNVDFLETTVPREPGPTRAVLHHVTVSLAPEPPRQNNRREIGQNGVGTHPVSYTHLTLPTTAEV